MIMNNWLEAVLGKISKASKSVQQNFQSFLSNSTVSIFDLAHMIRSHPDTIHHAKQYLRLTFHFYHLKIDNYTFYLETKGEHEDYILFLKIYAQNEKVLDFQSYINDESTFPPIPAPKEITNTVK
jgi:hypothetical protein